LPWPSYVPALFCIGLSLRVIVSRYWFLAKFPMEPHFARHRFFPGPNRGNRFKVARQVASFYALKLNPGRLCRLPPPPVSLSHHRFFFSPSGSLRTFTMSGMILVAPSESHVQAQVLGPSFFYRPSPPVLPLLYFLHSKEFDSAPGAQGVASAAESFHSTGGFLPFVHQLPDVMGLPSPSPGRGWGVVFLLNHPLFSIPPSASRFAPA